MKFANKVILNELKKQLGLARGRWTKELLEVFVGIPVYTPVRDPRNIVQPQIQNEHHDHNGGHKIFIKKTTL